MLAARAISGILILLLSEGLALEVIPMWVDERYQGTCYLRNKHMGDTQSPYSAGLEVQLEIDRGCAGGRRGGPAWWMLMSSQMGNGSGGSSGHT